MAEPAPKTNLVDENGSYIGLAEFIATYGETDQIANNRQELLTRVVFNVATAKPTWKLCFRPQSIIVWTPVVAKRLYVRFARQWENGKSGRENLV